jgi:hypothetical protein
MTFAMNLTGSGTDKAALLRGAGVLTLAGLASSMVAIRKRRRLNFDEYA